MQNKFKEYKKKRTFEKRNIMQLLLEMCNITVFSDVVCVYLYINVGYVCV